MKKPNVEALRAYHPLARRQDHITLSARLELPPRVIWTLPRTWTRFSQINTITVNETTTTNVQRNPQLALRRDPATLSARLDCRLG